jgi:hypothetical protein
VWSAVSGRLCKWYDAHLGPMTSLSWHPLHSHGGGGEGVGSGGGGGRGGGNTLVTGCEDGVLRLWSIQGAPSGAGKPLYECWAHRGDDGEGASSEDSEVDEDESEGTRKGEGGGGEVWETRAECETRWAAHAMMRRGGLGGAPRGTGAALCVSHSPGGGKLATVGRNTCE